MTWAIGVRQSYPSGEEKREEGGVQMELLDKVRTLFLTRYENLQIYCNSKVSKFEIKEIHL